MGAPPPGRRVRASPTPTAVAPAFGGTTPTTAASSSLGGGRGRHGTTTTPAPPPGGPNVFARAAARQLKSLERPRGTPSASVDALPLRLPSLVVS
mmetsp:Transcript_15861/g.63940  ORF Transcript_15861/g.63940 Transcript_15861/m.63940 type:complete len:95 (-) Transcript_15861:385-669(-)